MPFSIKNVALLAAAFVGQVAAIPQGVTDLISPQGSPPAGAAMSLSGQFELTFVALDGSTGVMKRDLTAHAIEKRAACGGDDILVCTLENGVLKDAKARTGYIASNFQFQFDGPPQAGAIFTAGFSIVANGSLALGPSATFFACKSGDFYNLYDRHWAEQCQPIHLNVMPCGASAAPAVQIPDGQVIGTTLVATTIVTILPDGQPQAVPTQVPVPICQIGDGQVQGHTTPCASLPPPAAVTPAPPAPAAPSPTPSHGQPGAPVSQIPDGQIQVSPPFPTAPPSTVSLPTASRSVPGGGAPGVTPTAGPGAPSAPPAVAGASRLGSSESLIALVIGVFGAVLAF